MCAYTLKTQGGKHEMEKSVKTEETTSSTKQINDHKRQLNYAEICVNCRNYQKVNLIKYWKPYDTLIILNLIDIYK